MPEQYWSNLEILPTLNASKYISLINQCKLALNWFVLVYLRKTGDVIFNIPILSRIEHCKLLIQWETSSRSVVGTGQSTAGIIKSLEVERFNNNYIYRIWIYLVQVYTLDNIRNVIFCSSLKGYNQKAILHTSSWEVKPGLALIIHKIKQIHLLQNADFVFSDGCVCQGYILYFVYLHANL